MTEGGRKRQTETITDRRGQEEAGHRRRKEEMKGGERKHMEIYDVV